MPPVQTVATCVMPGMASGRSGSPASVLRACVCLTPVVVCIGWLQQQGSPLQQLHTWLVASAGQCTAAHAPVWLLALAQAADSARWKWSACLTHAAAASAQAMYVGGFQHAAAVADVLLLWPCAELMELRHKFEEGRRRLVALKAARHFKPS